MASPAVSVPSPVRGPPAWGQKVSAYTNPQALRTGIYLTQPQRSLFSLLFHGSFIYKKIVMWAWNIGPGLAWGFRMKSCTSSILIPHLRCLFFLGLSGLPFCHQANLISGPHSYGPARETDSCTEGEASENISSLSAPLGLVLREKVGRQGI